MTGTGGSERLQSSAEPALFTLGSPEEPIRYGGWRSRPGITDFLISAAYAGPALVTAAVVHETIGPEFVLQLFAVVASGTALLFRRRAPMYSFAATAGIMLLTFPAPASFAAVAAAMALYAVAVYRSPRHAAIALAGTSGVLLLAAVLLPASMVDPGQAGQAIAALVIAALIGFNVRSRRSYVAALVDRADRLVRERQHLASIAAAAERNAIAREMHDIVSHGLAVMISLAHGSAEIAPSDPARAAEAMRQVAATGRAAVADMRRMLGVLNEGNTGEPPGTVTPAPGVRELPVLVELFRSTGLPVVLRSAGIPPADADTGIQLAIYRVVQEGLTNALRHAREASTVAVEVQFRAEEITVSVIDDGQHDIIPAGHSGRGLVGMRERVALYGGTMEAGPMAGRGWSVTARFVPQEGASWSQ
ncbi:sensor histidine kinase [Pseudarthrobacter sp. TAF60_1]|uniref:sensor histidine kinase n=1 Tax=Pseudarthrobacter sp. TAF60_1 TaxID=3233071 RepID=UPI003F9B118B